MLVTAASLQDRDGARRILDRARMAMPSIALVWADGGYAGKLVAWVARYCRIMLEIVRKPEGQALSRFCRAVGWWNEPCPGWCAGDDSTATTNACPTSPKPWSNGP